jgi:hypothetical protein
VLLLPREGKRRQDATAERITRLANFDRNAPIQRVGVFDPLVLPVYDAKGVALERPRGARNPSAERSANGQGLTLKPE